LALGADGEAGEPHLLLKERKRARRELVALLKHELIHYELKDQGDVYHGHGAAFLKRARQLGIVNSYVLQRCFSSEEYEHTPTIRKTKKIPLPRFGRQVDQWFHQLLEKVVSLPDPHNARLYPYVQNAYVGWKTFSAAVKEKSDHVIQEIWQIRKDRRGKGLHELQAEYAALREQRKTVQKQARKKRRSRLDKTALRQLKTIDGALSRIRNKVEKDYGILLG